MLKKRFFTLFGIVGPLTAMVFISLSMFLSHWFSWSQNALSDLGHSINSPVAALFNFGLLLTGFFIILYSLTSFRKHAKNTSYFLLAAGLSLQFIAMFDEVYGSLHTAVSILFFIMLSLSSISYFVEKRSTLAAFALIIGVLFWVIYGLDLCAFGIAVPETVSSVASAFWVIRSSYLLWTSD
ncbi:MAG: DUF998 domain-containing protein [archaeon]